MMERIRRYPDGCYAFVRAARRGPCGHDIPTARARFKSSGLIAFRSDGSPSTRSHSGGTNHE